MEKCPFCGAETRPGDNFCLNCGNRLLPSTPSAAQPPIGEATLAAPEDWGSALSGAPAQTSAWADSGGPTIASSEPEPATARDGSAATAQATLDRIHEPARFILRSDTGETLQEYTLDKPEVTIGRAPNSDVLLSKDKLTSRRHATVRYENGRYILRDERSANGTFVNGQQIEELTPYELQDGDHIGIGEHELVFRPFGASGGGVEDMPTIAVPFGSPALSEATYGTKDELATVPTSDEFGTRPVESSDEPEVPAAQPAPAASNFDPFAFAPVPAAAVPVAPPEPVPSTPPPVEQASAPVNNTSAPSTPAIVEEKTTVGTPATSDQLDSDVTFNRLLSMPMPALPDMSEVQAALAALDGQVMSFQAQLNATQDALRNHEASMAQTANRLRLGIRQVSERMNKTIADVARSREALAWAELSQLMEDVMSNPRDIEYVTKLARKARELNKVFQIHQSVLNTMAECNSLLRSMIGEEV
ncbi:MAG TPA: FHA domain-containing protein [Ktedonobacteraceae bacterium]|nr:FHA domain-containing protein [Ktedonobacteraceae bacterium]